MNGPGLTGRRTGDTALSTGHRGELCACQDVALRCLRHLCVTSPYQERLIARVCRLSEPCGRTCGHRLAASEPRGAARFARNGDSPPSPESARDV
eukprot:scaffold5931_cov410-Prasinococcus_capsulatus_cf.AAC.8